MKILMLTLLLSTFFNNFAQAHGEDKPGPHGGFIRMPGAFHTEMVFDSKDDSFHVFLLDVNFENPVARNSSVRASWQGAAGQKSTFNCEVMGGNHFHCKPQQKYVKDQGLISLQVKRNGVAGEARYQLPLKFSGGTSAVPTPSQGHDHHGHH